MIDSLLAGSERAAIASFGSVVVLGGSILECNRIDLDGENKIARATRTSGVFLAASRGGLRNVWDAFCLTCFLVSSWPLLPSTDQCARTLYYSGVEALSTFDCFERGSSSAKRLYEALIDDEIRML